NKDCLGEDASKQERRIDDIDADEDITLVNDQVDAEIFDVSDLGGEEVFVAEQDVVSTDATTVTAEELTLAQALEALMTSKPKVRGIVIQEQEEPGKFTTTTTIPKQKSQDKGKGIMVEETIKPKKKDQIRLDEEAALKLQAEFDEEQILAREKAKKELEANISLIETWDDVQAKIDADHQLAKRLQAEKQQEFIDEEKATLFMQFLKKRRKFFTAKRAKEKRNKPQHNSKEEKLVQGQEKEKRTGEKLIQKRAKKQKVKNDKEIAELKKLIEIIPDKEEVAIDAIPLAVKSPKIVDWKIYKEENKSYYQIMRVDGKTQMYMVFSKMLKSFDKEDLEDLYKLIKSKYGSTRPVEDLDLLL
nr:hypothetical protein [Tanacetum cinerariifolium]